ncbi:hypothetical protein [Streptomyces sp. NPDC056821]|uniref:hypothetical protein n=1 Tax=unclassified Streptomyces TaxID=2593676 RepID=UPI0036C7D124
MTTSLPRPPRLLLITTVVLAAGGVILLALPNAAPGHQTALAPPPEAAATFSLLPSSGRPAPEAAHHNTEAAGASAQSARASELAPHGEGPAGDAAIQKALEAAWPADLPASDERQLLAAGRALLRADATGIGRAKWPDVFPDSGQGLAPAFAAARFRIQAAIARHDGADDRAVVHLVWAGADRGGTFTDGRISDWCFTRTASKKGASSWIPQPRI